MDKRLMAAAQSRDTVKENARLSETFPISDIKDHTTKDISHANERTHPDVDIPAIKSYPEHTTESDFSNQTSDIIQSKMCQDRLNKDLQKDDNYEAKGGAISLITLASMDDFSDMGASTITEDSFNSGVGGGAAYDADNGEDTTSSSTAPDTTSSLPYTPYISDTKAKSGVDKPIPDKSNKYKGQNNSKSLPGLSYTNGLLPKPKDSKSHDHIVDMNSNHNRASASYKAESRYEQWLEECIKSTDDLERIFVQNGYDNSDENTDNSEFDYTTNEYPLTEFAEKYFNTHYISTGPSSALSKTMNFVKRRSNQEAIPTEALLQYTKHSHMQTSLIRMLNPKNTQLACSIFKDICKYIRGDTKGEFGFMTLRGILKHGIEHVELRDEIYCQVMRQCNRKAVDDAACRAWHIFCLCSVAFQPCKTLRKYVIAYVRKYTENESAVKKYAEFCLSNLAKTLRKARSMPPSFPEVEGVISHSDMEFPLHLLDGSVISIVIPPRALVSEVLENIRQQLGLTSNKGWSLYESTPDYDRHIHEVHYLADVISKWEQNRCAHFWNKIHNIRNRKERKQMEAKLGHIAKCSPLKDTSSKKTPSKKDSPKKKLKIPIMPKMAPLQDFGKLVFCKRVFERVQEVIHNPNDVQLVYSQAVHYNIHLDEYNVNLGAALHLAGLQAQVEHGEYEETKHFRYQYPEDYICERLLNAQKRSWSDDIAAAHKRYGMDKSKEEAKIKYLTMVSQFPLYGCTKVFAHYRGIWPFGAETVLALDAEGIKFISIKEKQITFTFFYSEIEDLQLEEQRNEYYITIHLRGHVIPHQQKCFLFECLDLEDFAKCIECHSPKHATWLKKGAKTWRQKKFQQPEDWLKLSDSITACRLSLIKKSIVRSPSKSGSGLLRSALNKFSRQSQKGQQRARRKASNNAPSDEEFQEISSEEEPLLDESQAFSNFWAFSKSAFKTSLLQSTTHEMEDVSARMFNSTLVYAGLESSDALEAMDLVIVVQALIIKCMEKKDLCNELYLQLIKQTTDTQSDSNEKAVLRYWHLMTMATCVMFPPNPIIFHYLTLHLKRYAMEKTTETGQYALFCIKNLYRTQESVGRKYPPSFKEIDFVIKRQAIEARVSLPDGHQMLIEFDSASTAQEVLQLIKAKAGMRLDARGFAIYLILGLSENYISPTEHLADSLHQWESWAKTSGCKDLKFVCKKRLFLNPPVNYKDPVEVDLVYHQSVTDLFEQKIPLTKKDAVLLCALRAQTEFGDYGHANSYDYSSVMRILPRHLRVLINVEDIPIIHKTLLGTRPTDANITFMDILRHWPLYGATMFEVTQSSWETLPQKLWLAVSQMGVHLMEFKGQKIFYTYTFDEIQETSPTNKGLTFVIGHNESAPSMLFVTKDAMQINQLITDYRKIKEQTAPSQRLSSKPKSSSPFKGSKLTKNFLANLKSTNSCNVAKASNSLTDLTPRTRASSFGNHYPLKSRADATTHSSGSTNLSEASTSFLVGGESLQAVFSDVV